MERRKISVIYGTGRGKTTGALGQAILAAGAGEKVILVQFLKGKSSGVNEFLKRMEPEIKVFRFDHSSTCYRDMTDEEKEVEQSFIQTGLKFSRKVMMTEGCDVLIMDEVLGLLEYGILSLEEFRELIDAVPENMHLILTGIYECPQIWEYVDEVTKISPVKESTEIKTEPSIV